MENDFSESFRTLLQQFRESSKNTNDESTEEEEESSKKEKLRQLRQAEDVVKSQGIRIVKLRKLKQVAIENEDYMTAKQIKNEIANIESAVVTIDTATGRIPDGLMEKL